MKEASQLIKQGDEGLETTHSAICKEIAGYILILTFITSMVVSAACAQALGGTIPTFELNMWRYLPQFGLAFLVVVIRRSSIKVKRESIPWLLIVCCFSVALNICLYESTIYVPLGTVGGLVPSEGLILTSLVTLVISRRCQLHIAIAVVTCITGIMLITQPEFIFHTSTSTNLYLPVCVMPMNQSAVYEIGDSNLGTSDPTVNTSSTNHAETNFHTTNMVTGHLLILGVAITQTTVMFASNIKLNTLDPVALSLWVGLGGTIPSMILMFIFETPVLPGTSACHLLLFGHAFLAGAGCVCGFAAFLLLPPVKPALIQTLAVVLTFVGQHTAMKHIYPGVFNAFSIVGAVVILIGNIIIPVHMLWVAKHG